MEDREDEPTESPATWENIVVGKAKEVVGHVVGDHGMIDEGAAEEEAAHEVRDEFTEERENQS